MNMLHMKYAVVIAETGSINRAADVLLIAQPNLSRAVKELESDLGISIFDRSSKGMFLTPDGEKFISFARRILEQIDEVENMYKVGAKKKRRFSLTAPYLSYVSEAFARFCVNEERSSELYYYETNSASVMELVSNGEYRLGVLRYPEEYEKYLRLSCEDKGLTATPLFEFKNLLTVSENSPLVKEEHKTTEKLAQLTEVIHADRFVPSGSLLTVRRLPEEEFTENRIYVYERASQLDVLSENPKTFMWTSPIPEKLLRRYGIVQLKEYGKGRTFKDTLICRKGFSPSETEKRFIAELEKVKREVFE